MNATVHKKNKRNPTPRSWLSSKITDIEKKHQDNMKTNPVRRRLPHEPFHVGVTKVHRNINYCIILAITIWLHHQTHRANQLVLQLYVLISHLCMAAHVFVQMLQILVCKNHDASIPDMTSRPKPQVNLMFSM